MEDHQPVGFHGHYACFLISRYVCSKNPKTVFCPDRDHKRNSLCDQIFLLAVDHLSQLPARPALVWLSLGAVSLLLGKRKADVPGLKAAFLTKQS